MKNLISNIRSVLFFLLVTSVFLSGCLNIQTQNPSIISKVSKDRLNQARTQWLNAFNNGDYNTCANMYTEDAVFIMFNSGNPHKVAIGREEIREQWKAVINDFKLRNLRASGARVYEISENEVRIGYDLFKLGNEENKDSVAFKGIIYMEKWVGKDGKWLVERDVTEALKQNIISLVFVIDSH